MSPSLAGVHARLRAAERALALAGGGSTELAHVREATGSLLVALHELVDLWEKHTLLGPRSPSPGRETTRPHGGGLDVEAPLEAAAPPTKRARSGAVRR